MEFEYDMIFAEMRLSAKSQYDGADWGDIMDIANAKGITTDELILKWRGTDDLQGTNGTTGQSQGNS